MGYRILSIGNFGRGWDGSICDEEHIATALESLGHEVYRLPRGSVGFVWPEADFTLIAQWDQYTDSFLERLPRPLVYWAFDYQADGQAWHERLVSQADLYLSKRLADAKYPNWQWLSQDFAPMFLDRAPEREKDIDVLFTGSYLPWATERNETLKKVDERFNLVIHTINPQEWRQWGFKHVEGPIMDEGLPELIARAKINLAIDHTLEAGYWSDRAAQIICCGGFVLHRYVPLLESIYRSHIAYFFGQEDCLEAIEYWLEHDEDREMVAGQAYDYSELFTVKERVADLLNIVRSIL